MPTTTLYRKTKDVVRKWQIDLSQNRITTLHGLVDGEKQLDHTDYPNPTIAQERYESKIAHKLSREGYSTDPNTEPPGAPMLLHNFRDHKHKLPNNVYYQPKLNGYRCVGSKHFMLSRRNDLITSMPHIKEELQQLPPEITLDGELYCHGLSLQEHGSLIRKHEPDLDHKCMKYIVFDIQMEGRYSERYQTLMKLLLEDSGANKFKHIKLVENRPDHVAKCDYHLNHFLNLGFEGTIIRSPFGRYLKDGRSYEAQKYKPIYSNWFKVVDIVASTSGREKGAAIVVCEQPGVGTFKARIAQDLITRKYIFENKDNYLPGAAFIEHSDLTDKGIPEHPRCIKFIGGGSVAKEKSKENQTLKVNIHPETITCKA